MNSKHWLFLKMYKNFLFIWAYPRPDKFFASKHWLTESSHTRIPNKKTFSSDNWIEKIVWYFPITPVWRTPVILIKTVFHVQLIDRVLFQRIYHIFNFTCYGKHISTQFRSAEFAHCVRGWCIRRQRRKSNSRKARNTVTPVSFI